MSVGRIREARLFTDRAELTRSVEVSGDEAAAGVAFDGLAVDLDAATVRAAAWVLSDEHATASRVRSVVVEPEYEQFEEGRLDKIQEEMKEIDVELASLADAENTEEHATSLIDRYATLAMEDLSADWLSETPHLDRWTETFDHLRKTRSRLAKARAIRREDRKRLQQRLADLLAEERRVERPTRVGSRVRVVVDCPKDAKSRVQIDLAYFTQRARWSPGYDARYVPAKGNDPEHVHLALVAIVSQTTGEDWEDVQIVATTAPPPVLHDAPQLSKVVLRGSKRGGGDSSFAAVMDSNSAAAIELHAPNLMTVASRLQPTRVLLYEEMLLANAHIEITPRRRPVATRVAEVTNDSRRVLLPGRVSIFDGPGYAGQTMMERVEPGEKFSLPLGVERTVRVRRAAKMSSHKSAIVGTLSHTFEVSTWLENLADDPIEVLLLERIPVSHTDDTNVKLLNAEHGQEVNPDSGLSRLLVRLDGRGRREVSTMFRVTAPRGFEVSEPRGRSR
ncbi:MAG: DUF4139 domain-containing protein [Deltaproteobacteria bacterium]|jgi:hypothetical protein